MQNVYQKRKKRGEGEDLLCSAFFILAFGRFQIPYLINKVFVRIMEVIPFQIFNFM